MRDLVLLPGWSQPADLFDELVGLLSSQWRVTVLPLSRGASLDALAQAALAQAPLRATWCGVSLGGMVAARAALFAPERVEGLLAVATNLSFVASEGWPHAMSAPDFAAFNEALVAAGDDTATLAAVLTRFDALQVHGSRTAREELRRLRACRAAAAAKAPDPQLLREGLQVLRDADLRADIARLACHSTWLLGAQDALVPAAIADDLRALLPAAGVIVTEGAGHLPWLQDPALLVAALDSFSPLRKHS